MPPSRKRPHQRADSSPSGPSDFGRLDRPPCLATRVEQLLREAIVEGRMPIAQIDNATCLIVPGAGANDPAAHILPPDTTN